MIFPLRIKLALLTSLLLVAGIGTVSFLVLNQSSSALVDEAQKRGAAVARDLARNVRDPLLLEDDLVLQRLITTVAQESEVRAVRIAGWDLGALLQLPVAEVVAQADTLTATGLAYDTGVGDAILHRATH